MSNTQFSQQSKRRISSKISHAASNPALTIDRNKAKTMLSVQSLPTRLENTNNYSKGEYEQFQAVVRKKLIECGWTQQIRQLCKEVINEKKGELTAPQMIQEVSSKARGMLPLTVKKELLKKFQEHLGSKKKSRITHSTEEFPRG